MSRKSSESIQGRRKSSLSHWDSLSPRPIATGSPAMIARIEELVKVRIDSPRFSSKNVRV